MANFVVGQKYFYISDHSTGFKKRLKTGTLVRVTPKFCVLDITKPQGKSKTPPKYTERRKAMKFVYETKKECLAVLIRRIESQIIEEYDINILELSEEYQELMEEYPERFV